MSTRISTDDVNEVVWVDAFDEGVWLNVQVKSGGARLVLTKAQAQYLVATINMTLKGEMHA